MNSRDFFTKFGITPTEYMSELSMQLAGMSSLQEDPFFSLRENKIKWGSTPRWYNVENIFFEGENILNIGG